MGVPLLILAVDAATFGFMAILCGGLEAFFAKHAGTHFSHGIGPSCLKEHHAAEMGK
jgi:hypothetical protein